MEVTAVPDVVDCVDVTFRKEAWFGEQVKEQKKDLKLFKQAGQEEMRPVTCAKLSRRVVSWAEVQHVGPVAKSAPQTEVRRSRLSGYGSC